MVGGAGEPTISRGGWRPKARASYDPRPTRGGRGLVSSRERETDNGFVQYTTRTYIPRNAVMPAWAPHTQT